MTVLALLIFMCLMSIIRWIVYPIYGLSLILYTVSESIINGLSALIGEAQKQNNGIIEADK
jgi:uncharacterized membrane protein YqjE